MSSPRMHALALGAIGLLAAAPSAAQAVSFQTAPSVSSTIALPERTGTAQLYQQAYDPATGLLYVADVGNQKVNVVYTAQATRVSTGSLYKITGQGGAITDPAPGTIVKRISSAGATVYGLGIDPTTHKLYGTATADSKLVIIQGNDGTPTGSAGTVAKIAALPGHTRDVVVNPATHKVYIDQTTDNAVAEVDGTTGRVLRTFDASDGDSTISSTAGLTANWDEGVLYAANLYGDPDRTFPGTISVIDVETGDVKQLIDSGGRRATTLAYDATRHRLFVGNQGSTVAPAQLGSVTTFDIDTDGADAGELALVTTTPTTKGALGVAVDEYNGLVYSTDFGAVAAPAPSTVTLLSADTGAKLSSVAVGSKPLHTVVDPISHTAYVTNQADGTITVINGSVPPKPTSADASTVSVTPTTAAAGDTVTVTGTGFSDGQLVSVKLDDVGATALASTNALADGTFSLAVTIPAATKSGPRHWLRVLGAANAATTPATPARSKTALIKLSSPTATVTGLYKQAIRIDAYNLYQSAYNPKTGLLYVADPGASRIRVIYTAQATRESTGGRYVIEPRGGGPSTDPAVNSVVKSIDVTDAASFPVYGLGINTKTNQLYGSTPSEDGSLVVINGYTDTIKKTIKLGASGGQRDIRIDEANNLVYAVQANLGQIAEIDGATNTLKRSIVIAPENNPAFKYPAGLTLNLEKGIAYVASLDIAGFGLPPVDGSVSVVDLATGKTVQNLSNAGPWTATVAYDKGSSKLFAVNQGQDELLGSVSSYAIDPATGLIAAKLRTEPTAKGALGLAIDAPRGVIYSTDYGFTNVADAHTVSVLSIETGEKIGSIDVGVKPLNTSIDPNSGTAYVTNQDSATVSVITPGKLLVPPAPPVITPLLPQAKPPVKADALVVKPTTTLSKKTIKVGQSTTVRIKLGSGNAFATGKLTYKIGGKKKSVTLKGGTAKFSVKGVKAGKLKITWTYAGSATVKATKGSLTVKVTSK